MWLFRYYRDDTLTDRKVSANYTFMMAYDSTCRIFYTFTEPIVRATRLRLLHWKYDRVVNAGPEYLNFNSRTENFAVRTGDTVSFFKEWRWVNPQTGGQALEDFHSLDTLAYVAYLVRASDSQCVALLDSMFILPALEPGAPRVYGTPTTAGLVRFVIPSSMNGDSLFIGVGAFAAGPGPYYFTRRDAYTIAMSDLLDAPWYQTSLQYYNSHLLQRRSVDDFIGAPDADSANVDLRVTRAAGAGNEIVVDYRDPGGTASVVIYRADGGVQVGLRAEQGRAGRRVTRCRLAAGAYFVTLQQNHRILATRKFIITQ